MIFKFITTAFEMRINVGVCFEAYRPSWETRYAPKVAG